jgi:hypothetical protein
MCGSVSHTSFSFLHFHSFSEAIGNKAIAFCGTSGVQMGWLASQADMLADDWMIVE